MKNTKKERRQASGEQAKHQAGRVVEGTKESNTGYHYATHMAPSVAEAPCMQRERKTIGAHNKLCSPSLHRTTPTAHPLRDSNKRRQHGAVGHRRERGTQRKHLRMKSAHTYQQTVCQCLGRSLTNPPSLRGAFPAGTAAAGLGAAPEPTSWSCTVTALCTNGLVLSPLPDSRGPPPAAAAPDACSGPGASSTFAFFCFCEERACMARRQKNVGKRFYYRRHRHASYACMYTGGKRGAKHAKFIPRGQAARESPPHGRAGRSKKTPPYPVERIATVRDSQTQEDKSPFIYTDATLRRGSWGDR